MQLQVPAAMLDSQEAFTGVTIKGGDLETGGDATDQPLAATCHDRNNGVAKHLIYVPYACDGLLTLSL